MVFITHMTTLSFTPCVAKWDLCCQSHDILSGENFNSCRPPNMTHIQGTDVLWLLRWKLFGTRSTVIKSPSENSTPYIKALSEWSRLGWFASQMFEKIHFHTLSVLSCFVLFRCCCCLPRYNVLLIDLCQALYPQEQYLYAKATGCNNHGEPHLKHLKQLLHWSLIVTSLKWDK